MSPMAPLHEVCHALPFDGIRPLRRKGKGGEVPQLHRRFLRLIGAENGKGVGVRKRRE
jgi:hypothetical protein